jgi:hypothetical protein
MPPKGYKRGYTKDQDGNWIDPRTVGKEPVDTYETIENIDIPAPKVKDKSKAAPKVKQALVEVVKSKTPIDRMRNISPEEDNKYTKIIISWRDSHGKSKQTSYTMSGLSLQESISEEFTGASKKTHMSLSIDGTVLEKG